MNGSFILSVDQGTSGTKPILIDAQGRVMAKGTEPLQTLYREQGWVEQDPEAIVHNVLASVRACLNEFRAGGGNLSDIKACGISNQRETFVLWDGQGQPLYNAVVWQCKRSIPVCERMKEEGLDEPIRAKTGLVIDPYFSSSKVVWLYENEPHIRQAIDSGNAFFGTVDTWILYRLTNGRQYYTDYTNASRTMFFHLENLEWDKELLARFRLSGLRLPEPKPSAAFFGESSFGGLFAEPLPIMSMIGDSHAAAFGEGCFVPGTAKATLGTGCSILMNIGSSVKPSANGMVTTICWSLENRIDYALEGVIVTCGATIEWLKNSLSLFADSRETEAMAFSVADNGGVYLVPSFSGMGAPYWDPGRKASISGLTFGSTKAHLVRAALESIAYQIRDVIEVMERDSGIALGQLMIDGGITSNRFITLFLADLLAKPVVNIGLPDVSALGAAYLAGLQQGLFRDPDHLKSLSRSYTVIHPGADQEKVRGYYAGWKTAVDRS